MKSDILVVPNRIDKKLVNPKKIFIKYEKVCVVDWQTFYGTQYEHYCSKACEDKATYQMDNWRQD